MERSNFNHLKEWLYAPDRKPLIIRGARQVGKTWLARHLADNENLDLIELNFEDSKQNISLFRTNDPETTIREIGAALGKTIRPEKSLLFLDEIQVVPELIPKLRWFYEKMPQLPVIATGSLLDFIMDSTESSMPVGRIEYMYLEPLSFEEFLIAINKKQLFEYINQYEVSNDIPERIHQDLMSLFKEYMLVGGLPAVISTWIQDKSLAQVSRVHHNLLTTYRDDFGKYRSKISKDILDDTFISIPQQLSEKFKYSEVKSNYRSSQINLALKLLNQARICHKVIYTHANGLPLGAETNEKYFKVIHLDVGLCSAQLGLTLNQIQSVDDINLINKGGIAEQVVGQILRTTFPYYVDPALFYWVRDESGANAEVDYILQHNNMIIPCEVKAGKTGALKSLHYFMSKKKYQIALRINSDYPSFIKDVDLKDTTGNPVNYALLSLPFYLLGQIHRLLDDRDQ